MKIIPERSAPEQSELGKKSEYSSVYDPSKLFPVARSMQRLELGINPDALPFYGFDVWNHYEVSWLNEKGKPIVALAEIMYPCTTPNIIESKSMKLYFNSFNNTRFNQVEAVTSTIKNDLSAQLCSEVIVKVIPLNDFMENKIYRGFEGTCIDNIDIECSVYTVDPAFLTTENVDAEETLYSDLLKSNCLVTGQPDWGSVQITYKGKKINHANLLKYIVSFRNHSEFAEHCVERMFLDIMRYCQPAELTVHGRYTRRGGLDINPYRTSKKINFLNINKRLCRQ
jgi:7-cyano-7-deazaguanine reductase